MYDTFQWSTEIILKDYHLALGSVKLFAIHLASGEARPKIRDEFLTNEGSEIVPNTQLKAVELKDLVVQK